MLKFQTKFENSQIIEVENPFILLKNQKNLDFRILDFKTICTDINDNIKEFPSDDLSIFDDDNFFVNTVKFLKQIYTIELFSSQISPLNFTTTLQANENLTLLRVFFEGEKFLQIDENFEENLTQEILKNMIREHYLIGIRFRKDFFKNIALLAKKLKNGMAGKKAIFSIANGVEAQQDQSDDFIIYKEVKQKSLDEEGKIAYDQKDYSKPIEKGELLFEYIKPKLGKAGRNLKGIYLKPRKAENSGNPFIIEQNIEAKENIDKISYFASSYGYLKQNGNKYSIINELTLNNVSVKKTGSIQSNTNNEISINITNNNFLDDAIQSGVKVQAHSVKIAGNVDRASVKSEFLYIGGSTHAKSQFEAKYAFINTHKGFLKTDIAFINNLENGTVIANTVIVLDTCFGATIKADKIYIKNALNYNFIYPNQFLLIDEVKGNMNKFSAGPNQISQSEEKNYEDMVMANELHNKINFISMQMKNLYEFILQNQAKIYHFKNTNSNSPSQIKLTEDYEKSLIRYKILLENYKELVRFSNAIDSKLDKIYGVAFNTKMVIRENFGEENMIEFKLIEPKEIELHYRLQANDKAHFFHLERNDKTPMIHMEKDFPNEAIEWAQVQKEQYFQ